MCCGLHKNPLSPILFCGWGSPPPGHLMTGGRACLSWQELEVRFSLYPASLAASVLACALDSANQTQMPETLHGEQWTQRAETVENTFWWHSYDKRALAAGGPWWPWNCQGPAPADPWAMVAMISSFGKKYDFSE